MCLIYSRDAVYICCLFIHAATEVVRVEESSIKCFYAALSFPLYDYSQNYCGQIKRVCGRPANLLCFSILIHLLVTILLNSFVASNQIFRNKKLERKHVGVCDHTRAVVTKC